MRACPNKCRALTFYCGSLEKLRYRATIPIKEIYVWFVVSPPKYSANLHKSRRCWLHFSINDWDVLKSIFFQKNTTSRESAYNVQHSRSEYTHLVSFYMRDFIENALKVKRQALKRTRRIKYEPERFSKDLQRKSNAKTRAKWNHNSVLK